MPERGSAAQISPAAIEGLLRECVTVVRPGETLIIRVPDGTPVSDLRHYQGFLDANLASRQLPFRGLVVVGDELAVAPQDVPAIREIVRNELEMARREAMASAMRNSGPRG